MKDFFKQKSFSSLVAYFPYFLSILVILRSRPFLRLPYDMWHHLMLIRGWYQDGGPILTRPGVTYHEVLWHRLWAGFFKLTHISDVFVWAKIIHSTQFVWALFCLGYFTDIFLKYWATDLSKTRRRLLALLGAWCFIIGAGTFSVQYQLSWILWYGVNYQGLTLPAYFLAGGLLMDFVLNESPKTSKLQMIAIPGIFGAMVAIHPLESSYVLIQTSIFILVFTRDVWKSLIKSPMVAAVIIAPFILAPLLLYILPTIGLPLPKPSGFRDNLDFSHLWVRAMNLGVHLQDNELHRGISTFNELALTGCGLLVVICGLTLLRERSWRTLFDPKFRVLIFAALLSSGFAMLPRVDVTSGILALLTVNEQVWRFTFASPWFLGFAFWASLFMSAELSLKRVTIALAPIAIVFIWSRFITHGPFNTNAASIFRSLELIDRHRVGIQFDRGALIKLDKLVLEAPPAPNPLRNIFLIRSDLQTYVRAATGAYVIGDRLSAIDRSTYYGMPDKDQYNLIVIEPPSNIPVDLEMAKAFPSMGLTNK